MIELTREDYVKAAELKKKGEQFSTIDALIAHIAKSRDLYLFTANDDFARIAKYTKLRLFSSKRI